MLLLMLMLLLLLLLLLLRELEEALLVRKTELVLQLSQCRAFALLRSLLWRLLLHLGEGVSLHENLLGQFLLLRGAELKTAQLVVQSKTAS